jgi:hypothetical protein
MPLVPVGALPFVGVEPFPGPGFIGVPIGEPETETGSFAMTDGVFTV